MSATLKSNTSNSMLATYKVIHLQIKSATCKSNLPQTSSQQLKDNKPPNSSQQHINVTCLKHHVSNVQGNSAQN